ncbi:GNAT family N-acetyltransferase [Arthrobacter sp. MMS24-T111]
MDYVLRRATPEDAEAIVLMHTAAHEESYGHLLSPGFFAERRRSIPERVARRRPYLDVPHPRIVAEEASGEIVGLADAGPPRQEDSPFALELYSIFILARAQGSGLGKALLEAALGDSPAYLWVLEENVKAQSFYLRQGFTFDGGRGNLPPEWESVPELRMVRDRPRS